MTTSAIPSVTVIVSTYNKADTLRYALESVLWQTYEDFECWVIGDACTDHSETVVNGFGDPRLKWFNLPQNSGYQSAPNNEGLRRASGQFIAYLNHDDIWLPNHLKVLVSGLHDSGADIAFTILEMFTPAGPIVYAPNYPDAERTPEATSTMHRRSVIDRIGYWKKPDEVTIIPRVDFFRRAQFNGLKFLLVPYMTVLKFELELGDYNKLGPQADYLTQVRSDPEFAQKELGQLLIQAHHKLDGPLTIPQLWFQFLQTIRRLVVRRGVDPGQLVFWHQRGQRIRNWRKEHGLDAG